MDLSLPRIRELEFLPFEDETHGSMVMVQDPLGIVEESFVLSPLAAMIAGQLDGRTSFEVISRRLAQEFEVQVSPEDLAGLINQFDEKGFLDNRRFKEIHETVVSEWKETSDRPSSLAGRSYPDDPKALGEYLNSFVVPRAPSARTGGLKAIVAPHIDLERGKEGYEKAYGALNQHTLAPLVIILGTGHFLTHNFFSITNKTFVTPLGRSEIDQEAVSFLRKTVSREELLDDFGHRREHSIEFQVLFLHHLYPDTNFRILPILCPNFDHYLREKTRPFASEAMAAFVDALSNYLDGKDCLIIAGVDFAHVGPRFGQPPLDDLTIDRIRGEDEEMISMLKDRNLAKFEKHFEENENRRSVCGHSSLNLFLELILKSGTNGEALHYGQAVDGTGLVSFGSLAYRAPSIIQV